MLLRAILTALVGLPAGAQTVCPPTPIYSPCELVFEMNDAEAKEHANPYLSVQLQVEFRSPRHRTFLMPAFWDGGRRLVVRFSPVDEGSWDFRVTSNLARFDGKLGKFDAAASPDPGFLMPANVHHWATTEGKKPHLWMGDTFLNLATADPAYFDQYVAARAKQKFTHVRTLVLGAPGEEKRAFPSPENPSAAYFQELDKRIAALNAKGIFADLTIGQAPRIEGLFLGWQERERFLRYLVARFAPFHITWQGVAEWDTAKDGRALAKEIGLALKKHDPYKHPRSSFSKDTSSPLAGDAWMDHIVHQSAEDALGAVEHQLYPAPFVNFGFGAEGAIDSETFRKRLWNAAMNGQYPTYAHADGKTLETPGTRAMTAWFDFFAATRYWELEPYFDVDGGRALALPGVEYIVYVEKPSGPIELLTERHSYDVAWVNPATGERFKQKKDYKGEKFTGEAPDNKQDWVLHVSREGRKEGMLRSYKFESRPNLMQEVEMSPVKAPFEIAEPSAAELSASKPARFEAKVKRETRATRAMLYLWTGEVAVDGQGARVLGTGAKGELRFPPHMAKRFPTVLNVRLTALNANGKAYSIDKVYRLAE